MRKPTGNGGSPLGPRGFGVAGLFVVPRLEELVADPWQVSVLDAHTARVLRDPGDCCAQCTQRPRSRYRARRDRRSRAAAARQAPEYKPSVREAQQEEGLAVPPS